MFPHSTLKSSLALGLILPTLAVCQFTWAPGAFAVTASDAPFASANGANWYLRPSDGLFCIVNDRGAIPLTTSYSASTGYTNVYGARPGPCSPPEACSVVFQSDGNLVEYYNGAAVWQSGTSGVGTSFNLLSGQVYAYITDASGNLAWQSNPPTGPGPGCQLPPDQC